ncbi:MAG TPA: trypsin-like serine protease, partial [Kofleriaceae bacterium]|nr:trypsin-like serine protease [Kofleriaceae bacterium]
MSGRTWVGVVMVLGVALCACQAERGERDEPGSGEAIGTASQPIIGGDAFTTEFESVCSMLVTLPPDEDANPQDPIYCTCAKIAPSIVLTSASCVEENLRADTLDDIDVRFGSNFTGGTAFGVTEVVVQRYYNPEQRQLNDLAMLRLDADPAADAVVLNTRALTQDDLGPSTAAECGVDTTALPAGCAVLVGFGEEMDNLDVFGARRKVIVPVRVVEPKHIGAGTNQATTCRGDSGGPVFMDLGNGGLEVVAVTSRHIRCFDSIIRTRVDVFADGFIFPYVDRFGATCGLDGSTCETTCPRTPDPDCDPCAWNDVCEEDCPTRDLDCAIGVFPGLDCTKSGDCELGGRCVAALDDASFTYCTQPCDPSNANACPAMMTCDDSGASPECVWPVPSPGSQGYPCNSASDCRSGICEETICVTDCTGGEECPANLANPEEPYTCTPSSTQPGKSVCLGKIFSGGGGFCSAGDPSDPAAPATGRGTLLLLGLVIAALALRRPRRR